MQLRVILRNKGLVLDKEVSYVGAKSKNGEVGILNGHASLITSLMPNTQIKYHVEQEQNIAFAINNAFLEVNTHNNNTLVTIITEYFSEEN